jgi:hypothetical protein
MGGRGLWQVGGVLKVARVATLQGYERMVGMEWNPVG